MKQEKDEEVRLLNDAYETLWAIVNSPESQLTPEERRDLNEKLEQLQASIKRIKLPVA